MPTVVLNLTDLDNLVRKYEQKYATSSVDMLKEKSIRDRIPEDDIMRWETYIYQRVGLRDASDEIRGGYLARLPQSDAVCDKAPKHASELEYAA